MKLVLTSLAVAELEEILAFLSEQSARGAANVEARFEKVFRMISEHPFGSQQVENRPGVRRAPLVDYPYVIYYRIREDRVEVLRIRHGARRPLEN
jgi:plasmid stabilization system protein ParE